MRRYILSGLIPFSLLLLSGLSTLPELRPTAFPAVAGQTAVDKIKRPRPTPQPTPRPNLNSGGGQHESWSAPDINGNASASGSYSTEGGMGERRGRRSRRRRSNANMGITGIDNTNLVAERSNDNMLTGSTVTINRRARSMGSMRRRSKSSRGRRRLPAGRRGSVTALPLQGTYQGRLSHEALGLANVEASLTINEDQTYTLSSGAQSYSGRLIFHTTGGYTAAIMELRPSTAEASSSPFISLRVRRPGNGRIILTSVPGEPRRFSFEGRSADKQQSFDGHEARLTNRQSAPHESSKHVARIDGARRTN